MRKLLLLCLVCLSAWACAAPRLLIVQFREENNDETDLNLRIDIYIAQAVDDIGQVEPVVWSSLDPVFRKAFDEGKIGLEQEAPTEKELPNVARILEADYVLVVRATKLEGQVTPTAVLYRGGLSNKVWTYGRWNKRDYIAEISVDGRIDPDEVRDLNRKLTKDPTGIMSVTIDGRPDWDSTATTIARTWAMMWERTAFKHLEAHPKVTPNVLTPDQGGPKGTGAEIPTVPYDEIDAAVKKFSSEGRLDLVAMLLRDAVDRYPFDVGLRTRLTRALSDLGQNEAAAQEAERAALISRDSARLWLDAARSWLLAENPVRAQEAVNQALARGAQGPESSALLGEIYVLSGDFPAAVAAYTRSIEAGPTPSAVIGRAIANGLAGEAEACANDLKALVDIDPDTYLRAYQTAVTLADNRIDIISKSLRELPPLLRLRKKDPALVAQAAAMERQARALSTLIDNIIAPERFAGSHRTRALAHKLILQSSQEILDFAKTGDDDLGEEGTISLGEALRLFPTARSEFRQERQNQILTY